MALCNPSVAGEQKQKETVLDSVFNHVRKVWQNGITKKFFVLFNENIGISSINFNILLPDYCVLDAPLTLYAPKKIPAISKGSK